MVQEGVVCVVVHDGGPGGEDRLTGKTTAARLKGESSINSRDEPGTLSSTGHRRFETSSMEARYSTASWTGITTDIMTEKDGSLHSAEYSMDIAPNSPAPLNTHPSGNAEHLLVTAPSSCHGNTSLAATRLWRQRVSGGNNDVLCLSCPGPVTAMTVGRQLPTSNSADKQQTNHVNTSSDCAAT